MKHVIKTLDENKWARFLFYFWLYTLLVILWGAWVRISHSGDGCGDHWPLCEGSFIPSFQKTKTWIEYAHRLMSGTYGLIVIYIFLKIRKAPVSKMLKNLNVALLVLMISEALLGAVLVKGKLVTVDDSFTRMTVMIFHQLNSFLLTGVTYLYYLSFKNNNFGKLTIHHKLFLFIFLILPITGAIAALSTTLFPSISVLQGIMDDLSHTTHPFIRLRILHPLFSTLLVGSFITWCFNKGHNRLAFEFMFALIIGFVTLLTLSPVYLKLAHLLIAHVLWARLLQVLASFPDSNKR
ncbi:MAG: COX15/CtaA family protein [Bdellovibrio sp.]|nr:COX15/CtaA family protein [Bdellovibrio sp.]